jgi:hypothetical protein
LPFRTVLFEFFRRFVEGEIAPGVAMPTVPVWPVSFSVNATSSAMAFKMPA